VATAHLGRQPLTRSRHRRGIENNWNEVIVDTVLAPVHKNLSVPLHMEVCVLRFVKRALLWAGGALVIGTLPFGALLMWPDPLFAYSLGTGKVVVFSDQPIPASGGERFLRDCERL